MANKPINQNSERYSKKAGNWAISASPNIKPIELPIGLALQNLKPLIQANGIIVKVGEDYLCSTTTLNEIKESNNPHYDIVQNGGIMVKGKEVVIGKTIKIIELDISRLQSIGELQDTKGIRAGVSSVEYTYEGNKTDGISNNLIKQIDYTLNQDIVRGVDTYTLYQLKLAPIEAYSLDALKIVLQPQNELLDMAKLKVFIEGIKERLTLLRKDFNMIKKMFFDGEIPLNMGKVEITTNGLSDPLQQLQGAKDYHQVIYKEVGSIQTIRDTQDVQRNLINQTQQTQNQLTSQTQQLVTAINTTQNQSTKTQEQIQKELDLAKTQLAALQKKVNG